jgi:hypothetical protein
MMPCRTVGASYRSIIHSVPFSYMCDDGVGCVLLYDVYTLFFSVSFVVV